MKIGIGLYKHMLNKENFRFAKQAGCTHIVVHLVDYWGEIQGIPATDSKVNWGIAKSNEEVWDYEYLLDLKKAINDEGLELYAIENFNPADWYDVLLDGPKKKEQIEGLKKIIRNVGKVGIPVFGYNFSIAGVWGHVRNNFARGGAISVGFLGNDGPEEKPIPYGQVWNMTYDPHAPEGNIGTVSSKELWDRFEYFLKEIIPIAEEAGVRMALHPDDPPMSNLRGTARLVYQPHLYQNVFNIMPSHSNAIQFCMGSIQEMADGNIYEALEQYASQDRIAYVHFRNVKGKVPRYYEVFVDEGDINMIEALKILKKHDFNGVLIPDHTPLMSCNAPWHAGMAFALGYLKAVLQSL